MTNGSTSKPADLCVVGAGVMGTWIALTAAERGLSTLLVDAFGPGDPRATSGGESRILRSSHGADRVYPVWARAARERWIELGEAAGEPLFIESGAVWFARDADGFEAESEVALRALDIPVERLSPSEAAGRWAFGTQGLTFVLHEPEAGVLRARAGVREVAAAFERAGGTLLRARVAAPSASEPGPSLATIATMSGERIAAGTFVFAAGPWLPALFPAVVGNLIRVTRQDVLFLGAEPGDTTFDAARFPAWIDYAEAFYGLPAFDGRAAKVAPDRYGPEIEPGAIESMDRLIDPASIELTRQLLRRRIPGLAEAPIVETRVCQYETTPDTHWVIDRHPERDNVWLVGGGSGHAFKHGPSIGRYVVDRLTGTDDDPELADRFSVTRPRVAARGMRSGEPAHPSWVHEPATDTSAASGC